MKFIKLQTVPSTHIYLRDYIKLNGYIEPVCVFSQMQTKGIGSRGNSWDGEKGNLFFSFVLHKDILPKDIKLQSLSIYFSFLLKQTLIKMGSKVWIKWPNDFYIGNNKIGGTITSSTKDLVYCGIGINLIKMKTEFYSLDIPLNIVECLNLFFELIKEKIPWKQVFSSFKVEFQNSKNFKATIDGKKVSLKDAILQNDGSIKIYDKKVFSLR